MVKRREVRDLSGHVQYIETALSGHDLLAHPGLNKGGAFSREERRVFGLDACLPYHVETLEEQVQKRYKQYLEKNNPLQKSIFLNSLNDYNETLFYKLVGDHLEEMLPIIYTPTIGEAVEKFSHETRRPRGLFLSYPDQERMEALLKERVNDDIDIIVVTDGEGVLGIGDQGVGAINISIGKLMVYTLCAKINPNRVLPIHLDVGTNNHALLNDPEYLGWRHSRVSGEKYDRFIERFVQVVRKLMPSAYLHWEDFGRDNARRILEKYRDQFATFNDDMQGTGMVATANIMAASAAIGADIKKHKVVMFGAGTAGVGIADQIWRAMMGAGLSEAEARKQFWLIDRQGLLMDDMPDLVDFQKPYARNSQEVAHWQLCEDTHGITLKDVVFNVRPTVLIGCSTVFGAFKEEIVTEMAKYCEHPIIMPLSNPNSHSEADPHDLIHWTDGKAMIACGSPYMPVEFKGKHYRIAQGNNAFVYPGLGLGVVASKAERVTDNMLNVACEALSQCSPIRQDNSAPLLPRFDQVHEVSYQVAKAVIKQAIADGVSKVKETEIEQLLAQNSWQSSYYPLKKI